MTILTHLFLFLLSAAIIWFFAGLLIDAIDRVARRFHTNGFTAAFFILGFMTSISEISVMINSTIQGTPQVSAGNLSGASFVILLLVVPLLAIGGKGLQLKKTLSKQHLALALLVIALPSLFLLDGGASVREGLVCLLAFGTLLYLIRRHSSRAAAQEVVEEVKEELLQKRQTTFHDALKIVGGAVFIFLAGHLLVEEAVYFSQLLSVPPSIIGLLLLSVGTNVPELVIAWRAIVKKHKDIAFGDYLGSTLANTATFAVLVILNRGFRVEASEFLVTTILMLAGFTLFYLFAGSTNTITRQEGWGLLTVYGVFVIIQLVNFIRFAVA